MIVLDASVLIAHLDGNDSHHAKARAIFVDNSATPFGASEISLAEALVVPTRAGKLEAAQWGLDRLGVMPLRLGSDTPARLAELRAETNRKLPDCCVLLAAKEHSGAIASFDTELARTARELGLPTV